MTDAKAAQNINDAGESALKAKLYRSAVCTLTFKAESVEKSVGDEEENKYTDFTYDKEKKLYKHVGDDGKETAGYWRLDATDGLMHKLDEQAGVYNRAEFQQTLVNVPVTDPFKVEQGVPIFMDGSKTISDYQGAKGTKQATEQLYNKIRYDQEYHFYKKYQREHPFQFKTLMEKLQYFDPAFHSMTPEGFNARLTFLHQCTRQGNTVAASDQNRRSANNMAFGRPPFCMLRIGDFYNQMILIDAIQIDYDVSQGITWDINDEGAGVQPMIAKININFTFIGGGDMGGAVRRLQNAQTFSYYANASLYDNRADRVSYNGYTKYDTMGGGGPDNSAMDKDGTYYHNVAQYSEK